MAEVAAPEPRATAQQQAPGFASSSAWRGPVSAARPRACAQPPAGDPQRREAARPGAGASLLIFSYSQLVTFLKEAWEKSRKTHTIRKRYLPREENKPFATAAVISLKLLTEEPFLRSSSQSPRNAVRSSRLTAARGWRRSRHAHTGDTRCQAHIPPAGCSYLPAGSRGARSSTVSADGGGTAHGSALRRGCPTRRCPARRCPRWPRGWGAPPSRPSLHTSPAEAAAPAPRRPSPNGTGQGAAAAPHGHGGLRRARGAGGARRRGCGGTSLRGSRSSSSRRRHTGAAPRLLPARRRPRVTRGRRSRRQQREGGAGGERGGGRASSCPPRRGMRRHGRPPRERAEPFAQR